MHPILFQFPGFIFYTQTLLLFMAFIAGLLAAINEGKRFDLPRFELTNIVLWGFLGAIIGARILFLLLQQGVSSLTLTEICTLGHSDGGFSVHGGLFAGAAAGIIAARHAHLHPWRVADALAPGLSVAMFFMRLGCLFNGCDYGIITTAAWGIALHGARRHPIQLYEGIGNLLLFPLLKYFNRKPIQPGRTCLIYLLLSAILRFGVDFYREDFHRGWIGLTTPQFISGGIVLAAGVIIFLTIFYKE